MLNVGIILDNLGPNQKAFSAIKQINNDIESGTDVNYTIFYRNMSQPCLHPDCSVMNINEIWHFNGVLIATDIEGALLLSKVVNESIKIFYVYDLEWIRPGKNNFFHNIKAFRDEKIQLVVRSNDYFYPVENYSNRQIDGVIPHFNIKAIIGAFYESRHK